MNDLDKLQAAIGVLDVSADNLSYSRADLGARMKAVDALQSRIVLLKGYDERGPRFFSAARCPAA